ncbi:hypothetical protein BDW59DRAFT_81577 [Aspergillus cavernicola]|uniref:Uncharacterized protein n=1 Tax=Aspergillus cavernicola TaxID=176166 RepID=A0ABR4IAG4_9EURO
MHYAGCNLVRSEGLVGHDSHRPYFSAFVSMYLVLPSTVVPSSALTSPLPESVQVRILLNLTAAVSSPQVSPPLSSLSFGCGGIIVYYSPGSPTYSSLLVPAQAVTRNATRPSRFPIDRDRIPSLQFYSTSRWAHCNSTEHRRNNEFEGLSLGYLASSSIWSDRERWQGDDGVKIDFHLWHATISSPTRFNRSPRCA